MKTTKALPEGITRHGTPAGWMYGVEGCYPGLFRTLTEAKTTRRAIATAERLFAVLEQNGNDYHERRIDHATFSARNDTIWREAQTDQRIADLVHDLLLNR